jgi:MFS family permease
MLHWVDTIFPRRILFQKDRRLWHLFIGRLFASTGFSIVIPFLALYLHGTRGYPMSAVGLIFFVGALTGAAGQIVGGEWCDRSGRKVVLVWSQLIRSIAFLALGLAVTLHAPFLAFMALTSLSAFAGRMFEPPSGAMIADFTDGERRAEAYGVLRIGGNLGWALGPAIGGFLAALSYASLFFVAAAVLLFAAILIAFKVEETSPRHRKRADGEPAAGPEIPAVGPLPPERGFDLSMIGATLRDRVFLRYCLITLIFFTVMAQLMSTLSVYVVEWARHTQVELGVLYTLNGLMVVFLQFPVVRILTPFRLTTAMVAGSLLYVAGYSMMGLGSSFALLAAAMFVVTSGEIVSAPASMNLVANFSSDRLRGRYMGVYGLFNSFGWSIGPLVGGVLLDVATGRSLLLWGPIAGLMLLAALGYWDLRRRIDPATDQNKEVLT